MENVEIAATGGTSGVVYGITTTPKYDDLSRVNTFLHVNHSKDDPKYGVLLCINGTGILNAWVKRNFTSGLDYDEINKRCENIEVGSKGILVIPFGNGAERMLGNKFTGAQFCNIDFNQHTIDHVLRASQEGIAFAFRYGIDIMKKTGLEPKIIKAGNANLFLSSIFRQTLSTICDAEIELYNTDGSLGAARGAALGSGIYKNRKEAFENLKKLLTVKPNYKDKEVLELRYHQWREELEKQLNIHNH